MTTAATTIAMKAAAAALSSSQECVTEMNKAFIRRKNLVVKLLRDIEGLKVYEPEGAFYVFPVIKQVLGKSVNGKQISTATDLCLFLLEEAHISTVPGEAFGDPDCLRISFANSDENLVEAMKRMKEALGRID
jgi:aspartate aminotransferase